jgi:D-alanine-D-alanine ligase
MNKNKVLLCYNEPVSFYSNYVGKQKVSMEREDLSESEFKKNLDLIKSVLSKNYNGIHQLGFTKDIRSAIKSINEINPDIIFNFVESIEGDTTYESYVAGMFEIIGIEYTGNSSLCLGNCLNKIRTKQLLTFNNVRTPKFAEFEYGSSIDLGNINLKFPMILKIVTEDASIGISENSVVRNFEELANQVEFLFKNYKKDLIVEEYISGRELNISIFDGKVLPPSEICYVGLPEDLPKIVTYEAKWLPDSVYFSYTNPVCPAKLSESLTASINELAIEAYNAMGCRDYARVDVRLNSKNVPFVIEVNPNPDISPDAGFVRSAQAAGINYEELLNKLASLAYNRYTDDPED